MAKIIYEQGDCFRFTEGAGVVIDDNQALIITGRGGRTGYEIEKGPIPDSALPAELETLASEIQLAIRAVSVVLAKPISFVPAIRPANSVLLTDFVPYTWDHNLDLKDKDFFVSANMIPVLEKLKQRGVHLVFDGSKSQGLDILSNLDEKLGSVNVFPGISWLLGLVLALQDIAKNMN